MRFCLGICGGCVMSVNKVIWNKGAQAALGGSTHTHIQRESAWVELLEEHRQKKKKKQPFLDSVSY